MAEKQLIRVFTPDVALKRRDATFLWRRDYDRDNSLVFSEAWEIRAEGFLEPLRDCEYEVGGCRFRDLSFLEGETLTTYPDHCETRLHADGTRFLYSWQEIPTFDSDGRVWDSDDYAAVYREGESINMIRCTRGYRIPGIRVYTGLKRAFPGFREWLRLLDCEDLVEY